MSDVLIIANADDDDEVMAVILKSEIIALTENDDRIGYVDIHLRNGKVIVLHTGANENGSASDYILEFMSDLGWA